MDDEWSDLLDTMRASATGAEAAEDSSPEDTHACCPHCGAGAAVRLLDGNMECGACHTVVGRFLDHGAEWRSFPSADDGRAGAAARCGPPQSALLPGLGCAVGGWGGSRAMRLVRKYQAWCAFTYRERTLCGMFDQLSVSAAANNITQCILDHAKGLYKQLYDAKVTRGELRTALVACSLYLAFKACGAPRSMREVARMFGTRMCAMTRACRVFQQAVHVEVGCSEPADFVGRFCGRLGLEAGPTEVCRHVVEKAVDLQVAPACTPPTLVAGAIWLAAGVLGLRLDRASVGAACVVSPATVGKCARHLEPRLAELLPLEGPLERAASAARDRPSHGPTTARLMAVRV